MAINFAALALHQRWDAGMALLWAAVIISPVTLVAGLLLWRYGGYEATQSIWSFSRRRIRIWALMVLVMAIGVAGFLSLSAAIYGHAVRGARSNASQAAATFESAWFRDLPDSARRVLERDEQMFGVWQDPPPQ